ncbi:MAG TPA: hypothetical protein PKN22_04850 [Taishania sp.]|nr:hypothetical protein [Taishania sp.]
MKNFSKKLALTLSVGALFSTQVIAADLCVNESGSGGCYASITDALTAAVDGDRIIIQPKSGGVPYVENITINKSVSLLSNTEGVQWLMTGNITITPAIGRTISILHMKNMSGNITASGHSPAGTRCKVNILNCELVSGYINFDYNYFNVNLASSEIKEGYVNLRYGNVIGNVISASNYSNMTYISSNYILLYIGNDALATDDTLNIVGNRILNNSTNSTYYMGVLINSSNHFFNISNNFITHPDTYYTSYGIYFQNHKNSMAGVNSVYNNSFYDSYTSSYYYYAIAIGSNTAGRFDIKNNLSQSMRPAGYNAFSFTATPTIGFSFNFGTNAALSGIPDDGTNNFASTSTINTTTGELNVGSDGFDAGYPDLSFYDLDLTRNDVGCYGGSFSQDNFFPITGAARVYFVKAPRTILQSGTLNVKAESFDR